ERVVDFDGIEALGVVLELIEFSLFSGNGLALLEGIKHTGPGAVTPGWIVPAAGADPNLVQLGRVHEWQTSPPSSQHRPAATATLCDSADRHSRVAEDPHPRAVLAPSVGMPRHLHRAEHALGVRHQDR